jgi:hypothetical protein
MKNMPGFEGVVLFGAFTGQRPLQHDQEVEGATVQGGIKV